jgi:hypothetical protein
MAKRKGEDIPALVLAVIAQIYELAGHRPQPWYVSRSELSLPHAADSVNSAVYYAEVSGWLVGAGEPAHGVSITPAGRKLLEDRGMI